MNRKGEKSMQKDTTEATASSIERRRFAVATIGGIVASATGTLMTSSSALAQNSATTFPQTLVEGQLFTGPLFSVDLATSAFEQVVNVFQVTGDGRRQILQAFNQFLQLLVNFSHTTAVAIEQAVLGINIAIAGAKLSPFVSAVLFGTARALGCSLVCDPQPKHGSPAFQYILIDWELIDIDLEGITALCHYRCFGRN
jgi:hypothetical protein